MTKEIVQKQEASLAYYVTLDGVVARGENWASTKNNLVCVCREVDCVQLGFSRGVCE